MDNINLKTDQDILDVMKRSIEYYQYIDEVGTKLNGIISKRIQPLLEANDFDGAKKMARDFFEPSKCEGQVIFIDYDFVYAKINQCKKSYEEKIISM